MIKTDIVNEVTSRTGLPKKVAEVAVDSLFEALKSALERGERIELRGFGVFVVRARKRGVGVHDHAGRGYREGALVHLLHQQPIRRVGGLEAVHDRPGGTLHDDGVDLAGANGVQSVFSLGQPSTQPLQFLPLRISRHLKEPG